MGRWALALLIAGAGNQVPAWANFGLDLRVVAFSIALSAVTALLFGWAPALHAIRGNLRGAMSDASAATTGGPGGRRTLSILVAAEFALAAVLLVCGGLLLRAYDRVQRVDPGFRTDHVLTFSLALPKAAYGDEDDKKVMAFWDRLTERGAATSSAPSSAAACGVVGTGAVLGTVASVGAARLLADRLLGVPPHDARILSASVAILLATAVIANWLPARRAAGIDPMKSLRAE